MRLDFPHKSIPELTHLTQTEQYHLMRRCAPTTFRHWQTWAALLGCCLCVGLGAYASDFWSASFQAGLTGAVVGAAIGGAFLGQVKGALVRPYLLAELRSRPENHALNR